MRPLSPGLQEPGQQALGPPEEGQVPGELLDADPQARAPPVAAEHPAVLGLIPSSRGQREGGDHDHAAAPPAPPALVPVAVAVVLTQGALLPDLDPQGSGGHVLGDTS